MKRQHWSRLKKERQEVQRKLKTKHEMRENKQLQINNISFAYMCVCVQKIVRPAFAKKKKKQITNNNKSKSYQQNRITQKQIFVIDHASTLAHFSTCFGVIKKAVDKRECKYMCPHSKLQNKVYGIVLVAAL